MLRNVEIFSIKSYFEAKQTAKNYFPFLNYYKKRKQSIFFFILHPTTKNKFQIPNKQTKTLSKCTDILMLQLTMVPMVVASDTGKEPIHVKIIY